MGGVGPGALYVGPASPPENGHLESFRGKLRGTAQYRVFFALLEVQVLTEQYLQVYKRARPHSSLAYRAPAPEVVVSSVPVPLLAD